MSYIIENLLEAVISDMKQEDIQRIVSDNRIISSAREIAVKKLPDKTPLINLAISEKDTGIQALMISYIADNDALLRLYNESQDEKVKQTIIKTMSDKKLLTEIAYNDKDENACLKLGGYLCSSCHRENLPEAGQPVSCACKHCQAENHHLERKHKTEEHNRSSETSSSWDECIRCGARFNYKSDFRYTDW